MKRFFILFALALSSLAAMADYTVYYDNSSTNWSTVCAYAYNHGDTDTDITSSWPGATMSGSGSGTWSYTISGTYSKPGVIFNNNNGTQTSPDFELVDGATYNQNGIVYTLWFDNTHNWSTVKIWAWGGVLKEGTGNINQISSFDDRPTMTKDETTGLYYCTFTLIGAITGVKFDDGNNEVDGEHDGYEQYDSAVNGGIYTSDAYTGYTDVSEYLASKENATTYEYTVKFDNTNVGWSNVYVWVYQDSSNVFTTWQGDDTQMTYNEETGLYEITFTSSIELTDGTAGLDFSTTDANADPSQTDDLVFYNNKTYELALKTWTIYFDPANTSITESTGCDAHIWAGTVNHDDWPGATMTYDSTTGYFMYQFTEWSTYDEDGAVVMFTNNSNTDEQYGSGDGFKLYDNGLYNSQGYVSAYDGSSGNSGETTTYEYTVKFDNTNVGWSNVYVWVYQDSSNVFTTWQGDDTQMTYNEETGLYEITFTSSIELTDGTAGLDFSTTDANADPSQTDDLVFYNNKTYELALKTWTIYFDPANTSMTSTSNLCAYLWVGSVPYRTWPGESMTYDESTGYFVYQFTEWSTYVDEGADVEFTNYLGEGQNNTEYGKDQSWALHDNGLYGSSGYIGTFTGGSGSNVNTYTVYFDDTNSSWGQVYVYIWEEDGSGNATAYYSGTYPGTQMTLLNSDSSDNTDNSGNTDNSDTSTLYYYTFTTTATLSANAKVLFSYNGDEDTTKKTSNYAFVNGATYSSTAMTTDANWFIYFDPDGIDGTITKVEVYMWHSDSDFEEQGGTAKDYFQQTDEMSQGTGENANYWEYSFYSNESNLGDQRIEVKFIVYIGDNTEGTTYGYTDSGTTQVTDWYLVNHAIYGTSGLEKLNTDQSGYVTYTVYYKQSESAETDGNWNAVYIYVFNEDNRSDHYCNNPSWPGDPMTSLGDNQWKYTFSAPQQTEGTVEMAMDFNDGISHETGTASGATQTSDMMLVNNGLYEHSFNESQSGSGGSEDAQAASNAQTYIVGAEIYVSSVGYATIYSDSAYVLPKKGDKFGKTNVADDYYFKDNVHATAITSFTSAESNAATADDSETGTEDESTGYAMTSWFDEGSVVPAGTALLIHSQKSETAATVEDEEEGTTNSARAGDTDVPTTGRYYLARVPNDDDEAEQNISNNLLHGSSTYAKTNVSGATSGYLFYKLANDSQGLGFYFGADNGAAFLSEPNKAWLAIPETQAANLTSIKIIEEADDNTATGLGAITPAAAKRSGDAIYNLQGIRVNDMSKKGIYIVGGRKVVVR
ncbi:MAG: starch-binding protein [Prevotella sp.]|nr:starch-binding protein [Prevotella sp.]